MRRRRVNSRSKQPKRLPMLSIDDFKPDDIHRLADDLLKWFDDNEDEPVLRAFFAERNISNNLVKEMINSNEYFAAVYEIALAKQESRIIHWGLKSKNAMPIFLLKALHGYSENPQPADDETVDILFNNFPTDEEMEQAREALKDERQRDAMLEILRQEEREKQFNIRQEGKK